VADTARSSFFRVAFDSFEDHIAVVDASGRVLDANRAWQHAVGTASHPGLTTPAAVAGLRSVLSGVLPRFELEQALHSGAGERWLLLRVRPYDDGGTRRALVTFRDVSAQRLAAGERERLVAALQFERNRLAAMFQQAPAFIAVLRGPDHVFELANDAYHQLVGFRDLLGRPLAEAVPELVEQGFADLLDRVRESGEPFVGRQMPVQLRRMPETPLERRYVDFVYQPFDEADGSRAGVLVHGVDVTEQVLAVTDVRESEERYRLLFERSAIPKWVYDTETFAFLAVNDQAIERYGYSREEFLSMTIAEIRPPEDVPAMRASVAAATIDGRTINKRHRHRTRTGAIRQVEITSYGLEFAGRPARLAMVQDVTEQSEAEMARQESDERYRSLVELSPDGIIVHRDGRVIFANGAAARMLGAERAEDLMGQRSAAFTGEDEAELPRLGARRQRDFVERRVKGMDGEVRDVEVTSAPFVLGGVAVTQTLFRDVTQRRNLEEQLRQAQKMEAVGQLAGGVAHDFNNLLTVIKANAELLLVRTTPDDPRHVDAVEIRKAADRAAGLTNQLLTYSRRQHVTPQSVSLNAAIEGLRPMLSRLIGEDIAVEMSLGSQVGMVMADPGQVGQVVMNLAVNARDAMPVGGRLRFETTEVTFDEQHPTLDRTSIAPGRYVALTVSDTGTGIPRDVQPRIFDPFFTTKPVGQGTGLGLSTVYGIVKQSGGSIWLKSDPGYGTTFTIYWPLAADSAPARVADAPAPDVRAPVAATGTILVAEDEDGVRSVVRQLLERSGYTVLQARNGTEALAVAAAHEGPIHLLLSDVVMPGMNGPTLSRHLLVGAVLFMSGYTNGEITRRGVLDAETTVVQKPFTSVGLLEAVREAMGRALVDSR
jgi:two-component system, cell cycle sensor histidine kinase and response regulator CckA